METDKRLNMKTLGDLVEELEKIRRLHGNNIAVVVYGAYDSSGEIETVGMNLDEKGKVETVAIVTNVCSD